MKTYAGLDLHSNNSYIVIIDDEDKVLYSKRRPNDLEEILNIFKPYKASLTGVVVESTYNWYWLADGLQEEGFPVCLATPSKLKQYSGLKYTDDKSDAHMLARTLKLGLLEEGYIMPPAMRQQRELARKRMQMVQQKTQTLLRLQSMLHRYYNIKLNADKIKRLTKENLSQFCQDKKILQVALSLHEMLQHQMRSVDQLEKFVLEDAKKDSNFTRLKSMPGVADILAMVILYETGEIGRFNSAGDYASYCRCVRSEKISNGKKKGENNRFNGNQYLRWAFIEAANTAIRCNQKIGKFYQRKSNKKHIIVAKSAVAHKLSRAAYYMLKDGKVFDLLKAFG